MLKPKLEKRKCFFWLFKNLSIVVACALPINAILEKFPFWVKSEGVLRSVGVGFILTLIVVLIIARRAVFKFIADKVNLKHAPPISVWFGGLIVCYILMYIGEFMADLSVVFWMGLVGCAIGNVLTLIANHFAVAEEKTNE